MPAHMKGNTLFRPSIIKIKDSIQLGPMGQKSVYYSGPISSLLAAIHTHMWAWQDELLCMGAGQVVLKSSSPHANLVPIPNCHNQLVLSV